MMPGLRFARLSSGLSQEELSERSGVHRDTIQKLETGRRPARPKTIKSLAAALGVEAEELAKEDAVERTRAKEKVKVEVVWEDKDGRPTGEVLRFRGEEIGQREENGVYLTLYECPDGYRVHVDYADGAHAYLNPSEANRFTGQMEYPTYTAEELVEEFPVFGEEVGVYRVRDID